MSESVVAPDEGVVSLEEGANGCVAEISSAIEEDRFQPPAKNANAKDVQINKVASPAVILVSKLADPRVDIRPPPLPEPIPIPPSER